MINNQNKEPDNFENALTELEEIVKKLESGNLSLDDSIKLYERGVFLAQYCNKKLEEAESRISLLVKDEKGEIQYQNFKGESNNKKEE